MLDSTKTSLLTKFNYTKYELIYQHCPEIVLVELCRNFAILHLD